MQREVSHMNLMRGSTACISWKQIHLKCVVCLCVCLSVCFSLSLLKTIRFAAIITLSYTSTEEWEFPLFVYFCFGLTSSTSLPAIWPFQMVFLLSQSSWFDSLSLLNYIQISFINHWILSRLNNKSNKLIKY